MGNGEFEIAMVSGMISRIETGRVRKELWMLMIDEVNKKVKK